MSCVVFGGSGQMGDHLLPYLRKRDESVVAFSRAPHASGAGVTWQHGNLPNAVPTLPASVAAIICLGPLDHFTRWLEHTDVPGSPRVVAMSSMSAQSKRDSPDAAERELAARLRDAEQRLLARCRMLGSACTILRATLIYGGPGGSLEQLAAQARRRHVFALPCGRGLRQPVHVADLALAVLAALERPQATGVIEAGGGECLTATAMFARVRRELAPQALGVPVPRAMSGLAMRVSGRGRGMVARLDQDLVADNAKLVGLLGVQPRPFKPGLSRQEPGR